MKIFIPHSNLERRQTSFRVPSDWTTLDYNMVKDNKHPFINNKNISKVEKAYMFPLVSRYEIDDDRSCWMALRSCDTCTCSEEESKN